LLGLTHRPLRAAALGELRITHRPAPLHRLPAGAFAVYRGQRNCRNLRPAGDREQRQVGRPVETRLARIADELWVNFGGVLDLVHTTD
jgi:hypothetical protein